MGIFLQFKRHFHDQSYFSAIVVHIQLLFIHFQRSSYKKQHEKKDC